MNSNPKRQDKVKKTWASPQLMVYGSVEKITTQEKTLGTSDGWLLLTANGPVPITNAS